jgi:hypothetical protein
VTPLYKSEANLRIYLDYEVTIGPGGTDKFLKSVDKVLLDVMILWLYVEKRIYNCSIRLLGVRF